MGDWEHENQVLRIKSILSLEEIHPSDNTSNKMDDQHMKC